MMKVKSLLLLLMFTLIGSVTFAQDSEMGDGGREEKSYDKRYDNDPLPYDSVFIPKKRMAQHSDFLNRKYPFPARPRNMWEVGLNGGFFSVSGDVHIQPGFGFGASLRKAFGYTFSLRGDFLYGIGKGLNYEFSSGIDHNPVYAGWQLDSASYNNPEKWDSTTNYLGTLGYVYHNYKTNIMELSLNGILTLNNIKFHKRRNRFELYGLFGAGGMIYSTYYDALDANGVQYRYDSITRLTEEIDDLTAIGGRKDVIAELKNMLDGEYETPAERHFDENSLTLGDKIYTYNPMFNTGVGIAVKLGRRVSLALEEKVAWVNDDLLDGQRWQEWGGNGTDPVLTREFDSYNYTSLRLNLHLGSKKSVEPLWWLNPLDYSYNELMVKNDVKMPDPYIMKDADGDCVPDEMDKEPNSQANCPVDHCGVLLDTDGDGVPDCNDKELITPTYCQKDGVDKNGVGKCPCCGVEPQPQGCPMINKTICFDKDKTALSSSAMSQLDELAGQLRNNPDCKVVICGNGGNKYKEQIAYTRDNKVASYLMEKHGFDRSRFIIYYRGECGNAGKGCVTVKTASNETGPSNPPPPHPSLGNGSDKE